MTQVANKICLLILMLGSLSLSAQTIYVRASATGANNGTSWANAYTKLDTALKTASNGTQIWVAAGVYKPNPAANATASFFLNKAAKVYGGFAGTETTLSQRNPVANQTILDGDIKGDDAAGNLTTNRSDNSVHVLVVEIPTGSPTAEIDGFIIRNGNTKPRTDATTANRRGGGIYLNGKTKIANCQFTRNSGVLGGGMHIVSPGADNSTVERCLFNGNEAVDTTGGGSALSLVDSKNIVMKRCTVTANRTYGGAMYVTRADGSRVDSCLFTDNASIVRSFGAALTHFNTTFTVANTLFRSNKVSGNGIVYGDGRGGTKVFTYDNCIFEANENIVTAGFGGGCLYTWQLNLAMRNCQFIGNKSRNAAAIYLDGREKTSKYLLERCVFDGNIASDFGGGALYTFKTDGVFRFCTFKNNEAKSSAGAIYFGTNVKADANKATVYGCTFEDNLANFGGALANYGEGVNLTYDSCFFNRNTSTSGGAGMHTGFRATVTVNKSTFDGNSAGSIGGAMGIQNDSSKYIVNNSVIRGNKATSGGGGIGAFSGTNEITVNRSLFEANEAGSGGAIQILEGDDDFSLLTVTATKFTANTALTGQGGGINNVSANMDITNTLFADNKNDGSGFGGGISINAAGGNLLLSQLLNCTFVNNISNSGGGAFSQYEDKDTPGSEAVISLQNNIFYNNISGDYIVEEGTPTVKSTGGNLSYDETMKDALNGPNDIINGNPKFRDDLTDFRLQADSPCRDKGIANGAPATDIDGNPRVDAPDMGAYEFFQLSAKEPKPLAITLSPNPSADFVQTSFDQNLKGLVLLEVANMSGAVVRIIRMDDVISGQNVRVPVSDLAAGTYLLRVRNAGQAYVGSFVKQ